MSTDVEGNHSGPILSSTIDEYIQMKSRSRSDAPGNYARDAKDRLDKFETHLTETGPTDFTSGTIPISAITSDHLMTYAQHLRSRWDDHEIAASTALTYYRTVSAFFAWAVRHDYIQGNPADNAAAKETLPDRETTTNKQLFWSDEDRRTLLHHVQQKIRDDRLDESNPTEIQRVINYRDFALVSLLAYTGVRVGEVFRSNSDGRRNGITWNDLDFDTRTVSVLGKSQEWEDAPLPEVPRKALKMYRRVLDPPEDSWPVFPTQMRATRGTMLKEAMENAGHAEREIDEIRQEKSTHELIREYNVKLPSTTTSGARNILQRLCDQANIDVDVSGVTYLQPHGARRKLGDELYRDNPAKAQSALRHKSIETTKESYSHIEAGEVADDIDELQNTE